MIYQRKSDGRWIVEIREGSKPSGKPNIKYLTAKTKTEANARLKAGIARMAQGKPDTGKAPTLKAYLADWLASNVKPHKRSKTYDSYEGMCRIHITPRIGQKRLPDLTAQDVQRMLAEMIEAGASPTTAKYARGILRKALNDAMRSDLIWRNVVTLTDMPAQQTFHPKPLTAVELPLYLAATRGKRLEALTLPSCRQSDCVRAKHSVSGGRTWTWRRASWSCASRSSASAIPGARCSLSRRQNDRGARSLFPRKSSMP